MIINNDLWFIFTGEYAIRISTRNKANGIIQNIEDFFFFQIREHVRVTRFLAVVIEFQHVPVNIHVIEI